MSIKEIKIEKIVCDICDKEMTQDEVAELARDMETPYAYFMDQVSHVRIRFSDLCAPYKKTIEHPDLCRNCIAKVLAKALYNVTNFKVDAEGATRAYTEGKIKELAIVEVKDEEARAE
jgi:hypothetical protein